ncbi:AAA domain-containing protein [Prauserella marina]|uniref:AAA domain-containing protein n=1 Tax=Prauserella marina TaxID=530584 RepID=A0A1G6NDX2_9PSEU|nr:AAA domain-containing protein [Prauserella marina]PWV82312.1 AAA domain-containing protein [Prauserella marina]SDC66008.1 AAA domain-containing protein [Prauserella marina]
MSDWRLAAASAVEAELDHTREAGEWTLLGRIRNMDDGGYAVDLRGRRINPVDDVRLAGSEGPREGPAVPVNAELVCGVMWIKVPGSLPAECDMVWVREVSTRDGLRQLADRLRDLPEGTLADQLAEGRPDTAPSDAYRACFLPGLRLVWGAPGSGKTHLIAKAAAELAKAGKRVLIVNAGEQPPRVPAATEAELSSLREDLAELTAEEQRIGELALALGGYDHETYLAVGRRIENEERSATLEAEFASVRRQHQEAAEQLAMAQRGLLAARTKWEAVEGKRTSLTEAHDHERQLEQLQPLLASIGAKLDEGGKLYRGRRADKKALREAEAKRAELETGIRDCLERAHPVTDDQVKVLAAELETAHRHLDGVAETEASVHVKLERLRGRIARLRSTGLVTAQDRRYHAECEELGFPSLHAERADLLRAGPERAARRGRLEERLWWLGERSAKLRADTEAVAWDSAQIVTTSPARYRRPRRPFDVVLVDDAGSARLADVLCAVAQAGQTAVVFGDFRQPGPRLGNPRLRNVPDVRRWLLSTPFSHCGIRTAAEAEQHPGCSILGTQFRFGPAVRYLAQGIGYDEHVTAASGRTEVVLLDTEGNAVDRAAVVRNVVSADGTAIIAPNRERAEGWLDVVRERFTVAAGTARGLAGNEFGTVLVDLTDDDWSARVRSFGSAVTRARTRLYLLADLDAVKAAPIGSPLGVVNALRLQSVVTVRKLADLLIPRQRVAIVATAGDQSARYGDQRASF